MPWRELVLAAVAVDLGSVAEKVEGIALDHELEHLQLMYEAAGLFLLRIVEYDLRHIVVVDNAFVHEKHPVADRARESHVVCHDQHRLATVRQIPYNSLDLSYKRRIESARRFVEQYHFRIHGKGPCDSDALLLTAGELIRIAERSVRKTYLL